MRAIPNTDEERLIALCRAGNDAAYTELYNKYARPVYNSINRIIPHTAEAEDILQEAFFLAFKDIDRLQSASSFGAWVKRIAINRSITFLRKRKITFADVEENEIPDNEEYNEEEDALFDCRVEDIKSAIDQLAPGYKTIVSLHVFEEMPQEEIGKMLGISHNTVRTQYHRAKKRVIQSLKNKTYHG